MLNDMDSNNNQGPSGLESLAQAVVRAGSDIQINHDDLVKQERGTNQSSMNVASMQNPLTSSSLLYNTLSSSMGDTNQYQYSASPNPMSGPTQQVQHLARLAAGVMNTSLPQSNYEPSGLGQEPMSNESNPEQELRFTAEDLMLATRLIRKNPELLSNLEDLVKSIGKGTKGRHELQFFFQSRGETIKSQEDNAMVNQHTSHYGSSNDPSNVLSDTLSRLTQHSNQHANNQLLTQQNNYDSSADDGSGNHIDDYSIGDNQHNQINPNQSSSNTGIRGITWQESRCSYQASVCISLKQIYKIFSAKQVGKEKALERAKEWLQEMRRRRNEGESLDSLMKAGLFTRKVSNTGIRGITWQESRMKFQCSIYMEKGRRVQKYFPTGLNRNGPRYEEAFKKAKEWTKKMEAEKQKLMQENAENARSDNLGYNYSMSQSQSVPSSLPMQLTSHGMNHQMQSTLPPISSSLHHMQNALNSNSMVGQMPSSNVKMDGSSLVDQMNTANSNPYSTLTNMSSMTSQLGGSINTTMNPIATMAGAMNSAMMDKGFHQNMKQAPTLLHRL